MLIDAIETFSNFWEKEELTMPLERKTMEVKNVTALERDTPGEMVKILFMNT